MDKTFESINTKLLAENLLKAREICGKSVKESSATIGIPSSRLKNYEKGKFVPSLPELESLSYFYRIPLSVLLSENQIDNFDHDPDADQMQKLIEIRQRLIGTRIQLARENADLSFKKLSESCGLPALKIKRYETGETPIPIDDLFKLKSILDIGLSDILDQESPVGRWQFDQAKVNKMAALPEEITSFITQTDNYHFIQTAKDIAEIGPDKLKQLSNSLLEIVQNNSADADTEQH